MIAKIESKTQYGKMGKTGINVATQLDSEPVTSFAHDVHGAIEWAKEFPLYEDAEVVDLQNGSFVLQSQWLPYDNQFAGLIEPESDAEYWRSQLLITPVNTIYENASFRGYRAE